METNSIKSKEALLLTQMDAISIFFADFERARSLTGVELLQGCNEREEIISRATQTIERVEGVVPFFPLNKENELALLFKGINIKQCEKVGVVSKEGGKPALKTGLIKREAIQIPIGNTISFNAKRKLKDSTKRS
jgi:hypothetical protein